MRPPPCLSLASSPPNIESLKRRLSIGSIQLAPPTHFKVPHGSAHYLYPELDRPYIEQIE
jgi:hypothetical protein